MADLQDSDLLNVVRDKDGKTINVINALAEAYDTELKGLTFFHGPMKGVRKGLVFSATHLFSSVSDTNSVELPLITGSEKIKFLSLVKSTGQAEIEFETGTTYSTTPDDYGTEIPSVNRKATSDNTATTSVYYNPTIDTAGMAPSAEFIPGGGKQNAPMGGSASLDLRYLLEADSNYLLRITNTSGSDSKIFAKGIWCE